MEELQDAGYKTIEAANGKEGLKAILRRKPDLVLCDISMPTMDGHELLTLLRENHLEFDDLPFIFLTSMTDRKDVITGRRMGVDDYLIKPIDYRMLLLIVKTRLKQVSRIKAVKEMRIKNLYKSFMGDDLPGEEEQEKINTVVILADDEVDLGNIHDTLEGLGYVVIKMDSGRKFPDSMDALPPDFLLISYNSTDFKAPLLVKMIRKDRSNSFPIILLDPPSLTRMRVNRIPGFDDYIKLPCDRMTLLSKVERRPVS